MICQLPCLILKFSESFTSNCLGCWWKECGYVLISKGNVHWFHVTAQETLQEIFLNKGKVCICGHSWGFPVGSGVKNLPATQETGVPSLDQNDSPGGASGKSLPADSGDVRHVGWIPEWGRSPGGRRGDPLQYSCLENPMDRGAWRAIFRRVRKNQTHLKCVRAGTHTRMDRVIRCKAFPPWGWDPVSTF